MEQSIFHSLGRNFLGQAPTWYKRVIVAFLLLNPVVFAVLGGTVAGWLLIVEFIFTLAMALKCYPLQPGGLLAIEAVIIGLTTPESVFHETKTNFEVILLLVFMVAGIYFMKDLLLFAFSRILMRIRSKLVVSLLFCASGAFLSAFLDALTVTAVLITVSLGFFAVYHKVASGKGFLDDHDHGDDAPVRDHHREDLEQFRAFLRSLVMHGAVGTALGGVCTIVGEPQNLLIGEQVGWSFIEFVVVMAPVTMPVLVSGLLTCVLLEKFGWFGYGATLPAHVGATLRAYTEDEDRKRSNRDKARLVVQAIVALLLVLSLSLHVAAVGLIGLMVIVLLTAFNGVIDEHKIGHAFSEALPFTALLVVFFAVVAVIHDQHLFTPVIEWVLHLDLSIQPAMFFLANGLLSAISDNVFVATIYITEVRAAFDAGAITREHLNALAVAINTGTNLPSVATPNGQAAFLFLLTSAIAPLIRLSYGRMVWMALPYTIVLTGVGLLCVMLFISGH
jgi:Na+:H+ antiporter, NhaB family